MQGLEQARRAQACKQLLDSPARATTSTKAYYLLLQELCALIQDGHTNIYAPNELADELNARPLLTTHLVEGRVLVKAVLGEDLPQQGIHSGMEVISVNGLSASEYGKRMIAPRQSASTPQDHLSRLGYWRTSSAPGLRPGSRQG